MFFVWIVQGSSLVRSETTPIHLSEARLLAFVGDLADHRRVQGRVRRAAVGLPTRFDRALGDGFGAHRLAGFGQDLHGVPRDAFTNAIASHSVSELNATTPDRLNAREAQLVGANAPGQDDDRRLLRPAASSSPMFILSSGLGRRRESRPQDWRTGPFAHAADLARATDLNGAALGSPWSSDGESHTRRLQVDEQHASIRRECRPGELVVIHGVAREPVDLPAGCDA